MPLDKVEGFVKGRETSLVQDNHRVLAKAVEDQYPFVITRVDQYQWRLWPATTHRFDRSIDHDSCCEHPAAVEEGECGNRQYRFPLFPLFLRSALWDARAPNQCSGLACADQGTPRAALDMHGFLGVLIGA